MFATPISPSNSARTIYPPDVRTVQKFCKPPRKPMRKHLAPTLVPPIVSALVATLGLLLATNVLGQSVEPKIKLLATAADPVKNAVLVGRMTTGNMMIQLEIEGSESMWMQMGTPPVWGEHAPTADERYHVELKLTDPKSKTRIAYVNPVFLATNSDTGKTMRLPLAPMWGSSGLHYSANSALLGNGAYAATVTVDVPTFERELKDKELWSKPVNAKFHFKLKDGKLTEVTQASR